MIKKAIKKNKDKTEVLSKLAELWDIFSDYTDSTKKFNNKIPQSILSDEDKQKCMKLNEKAIEIKSKLFEHKNFVIEKNGTIDSEIVLQLKAIGREIEELDILSDTISSLLRKYSTTRLEQNQESNNFQNEELEKLNFGFYLLGFLYPPEQRNDRIGDYIERYKVDCDKYSPFMAKLYLFSDGSYRLGGVIKNTFGKPIFAIVKIFGIYKLIEWIQSWFD